MCRVDVAIAWPNTSHARGLISFELLLFFLVWGFLEGFLLLFFFFFSGLQSQQVQSAKSLVSELHQLLRNFLLFYRKSNSRKFFPKSPVPLLPLLWIHLGQELVCGAPARAVSLGLAALWRSASNAHFCQRNPKFCFITASSTSAGLKRPRTELDHWGW